MRRPRRAGLYWVDGECCQSQLNALKRYWRPYAAQHMHVLEQTGAFTAAAELAAAKMRDTPIAAFYRTDDGDGRLVRCCTDLTK